MARHGEVAWTGRAAVTALEAELGVSFAGHEAVRYQHRERLNPLFEASLAQRTEAELAPVFEAEGVCWSPYRTFAEAASDPALFTAANPVFSAATQPSGLDYPVAGPGRNVLVGAPRVAPTPAPRPGNSPHRRGVSQRACSACRRARSGRLHDAGLVRGVEQ